MFLWRNARYIAEELVKYLKGVSTLVPLRIRLKLTLFSSLQDKELSSGWVLISIVVLNNKNFEEFKKNS